MSDKPKDEKIWLDEGSVQNRIYVSAKNADQREKTTSQANAGETAAPPAAGGANGKINPAAPVEARLSAALPSVAPSPRKKRAPSKHPVAIRLGDCEIPVESAVGMGVETGNWLLGKKAIIGHAGFVRTSPQKNDPGERLKALCDGVTWLELGDACEAIAGKIRCLLDISGFGHLSFSIVFRGGKILTFPGRAKGGRR
jgi:hypothetical protein